MSLGTLLAGLPHDGARDAKQEIERAIEDLNRDYALVLVGGVPMIVREQYSDDGSPRYEYLSVDAWRTLLSNRFVWVTAGANQRRVPVTKAWLESPERREYRGVLFDPTGRAPGTWLNLWRGFAAEPAPCDRATAMAGCARLLAHLLANVCAGDEEHFLWLMDWLARMVQRPADRTGTALVLRGGQGVGKTIVGQIVGSLFGPHYTPVSDLRGFAGRFNAHLETCLFLQLEEATWGGDHQAAGRLKDLITGTHHLIERKGMEPYLAANHVHVMITTNSRWAVPAGLDDRRFAVLDVAEHRRQDRGYFRAILDEAANGGREMLLRALLDYEIAPVAPPVPRTEALAEQAMASLGSEEGWWLEILDDGRLPGDTLGRGEAPKQALHDHYLRHATALRLPRPVTAEHLGRILSRLASGLTRVRPRHALPGGGTRRCWTYQLRPLPECRAAFCRLTGYTAPESWGDDDRWEEGSDSP